MSAIQRKALTKKVFQAELVVREKVNCHLSVQYDAKRSCYTLKQVWSTAEFILGNYQIPRLICGNFYVSNVDVVFTAFSKNENLRRTCQQYGKRNGLCSHVVAVAEKEGLFETFISSCIKTGGNINKVLNNSPENAGDKPKQKTQDVAKSTSVRVQLPLYKIRPNQQLFILKLTFQRENCLSNPEYDRVQSRISCKLAFPKPCSSRWRTRYHAQ